MHGARTRFAAFEIRPSMQGSRVRERVVHRQLRRHDPPSRHSKHPDIAENTKGQGFFVAAIQPPEQMVCPLWEWDLGEGQNRKEKILPGLCTVIADRFLGLHLGEPEKDTLAHPIGIAKLANASQSQTICRRPTQPPLPSGAPSTFASCSSVARSTARSNQERPRDGESSAHALKRRDLSRSTNLVSSRFSQLLPKKIGESFLHFFTFWPGAFLTSLNESAQKSVRHSAQERV